METFYFSVLARERNIEVRCVAQVIEQDCGSAKISFLMANRHLWDGPGKSVQLVQISELHYDTLQQILEVEGVEV